MLVLHPSSTCDVCLSEYTWDSGPFAKRPHAIACGHIFCSNCLYINNPHNCPLCRKTYLPNKIKRLHVDKPENIDDNKETDLLQRLAVSWETPDEQIRELMMEIDFWLRDRSNDTCVALRKARDALTKYRDIVKEQEHDLRVIENQKEKIRVLKDDLATMSAAYQTQVEGLQKDVARLKVRLRAAEAAAPLPKQSRNPLPRPPEPISTDHIPSFEQALSESGGMSTRFPELPLSPYSNHSSELSDRNGRGHARSDNQSFMTAPSTPSSRYVDPHISDSQQRPNGYHSSRPTSSQAQYESNKPINSYALTAQYVQSYYDGLVNGHQVAHKINQLAQAEGSSSSEQAQALPSPPNMAPNYTISQDYQPSIRDDASSSHRGSVYSSSSDRSSIRSVDQRYSTGPSSRSRRNSPRRSSGSSTTSSSRSDEQESTAIALAQHYSNPTLASSGSGSTTSRERSAPVSPQSQANSIRSRGRNHNDNSMHPSTRPQTPYTTAASSPSALGLEDGQVSMAQTGPTDNGPTSTINNFTQTHAHRNSIVSGVSASSWGTFQTVMSGISDGSLGLGLHVPHSFTLPIPLDESEQERLERLLQQQRHPTQPLQQHQEEEEEEEDEEEEDAVSFVSMPPSLRSEAGAVPPENGMHSPVRPVHSMVGVLPGEADENSRHTTSHRGRDDPSAYDAHHSQYSQSRSYATTSSARSPTHQGGRTHSHRSSRSQHQAPTSSSSNRNSTYSTSTSSSLRSYYTANGEFSQGPEQQQQQQGQGQPSSSSSNYYEPPRIRRTYANLALPDTSPFGSHNGYALYPSDNATYYDHRYNGSSSSSVHSRVSSPRYGTSGVGAEQGASDGGGRSSSAMRNNALGLANI